MSAKILFFVLTGIILMYGSVVDAYDREIDRKCSMHKDRTTIQMCILTGHGVINDKGEWNKTRFEEIMLEAYAEEGTPSEEVRTNILKCVDEGTGETVMQKTKNFAKCIDNDKGNERNFL